MNETEYVLERGTDDEEWTVRGEYSDELQALRAMGREVGYTGQPHRVVKREVVGSLYPER